MKKLSSVAWVVFAVGGLALLLAGVAAPSILAWQAQPAFDLKTSMARGKIVYDTQCVTCHQPKGEGLKGVYPPLAKSDYLAANKARAIGIVANGSKGVITVNGAKYDNEMLSSGLTDEQVSDVLNYVRNSWGNKGAPVKPEEVAPQRKKPAAQ
ncbi:MAG TPA: cytochrome c [Verrucomicrobiae bacterium]|nr:cytochrome c [Verrucomicrobiae bacterium]